MSDLHSDAPAGVDPASAEAFAEVARSLGAESGAAATLDNIVRLAVDTIPGCRHAGVSVIRQGVVRTAAATDDVPREVNELQYGTGEGPCIEALREQEVYRTGDLAAEQRWPAFSPQAVAKTKVRSVLSYRLFTEGNTWGTLSLYSEEVDAFPDEAVPVGSVFAAHAALAFARASDQDEIAHLTHALDTSRTIGAAIGILMNQQKLTQDQAFDRIRTASQHLNRKLRDVAEHLVETGELPEVPERAR